MAQQGFPPTRPGRPGRSRHRWPEDEDTGTGEQDPPWAGSGGPPPRARPGTHEPAPGGGRGEAGDSPEASGRDGGRGRGSRAAASRARRTRRTRHYIWGGAGAVVLVIAVAVAVTLVGGGNPHAAGSDGLVTTFLPGEYRAVPDVCTAVTSATLEQYLPGKRRRLSPRSLYGRAESLCDWSVDKAPMYRVLNVTARAYAPSGLASGDGSATFAAEDAYQQALRGKEHPPKHIPKAVVTGIHGVGNEGFAALQVPSAGGDTTDLLTVVVRQRNVLVTVVFDGLAHSRTGGYGKVSVAGLRAGAIAAVRDVLARLP